LGKAGFGLIVRDATLAEVGLVAKKHVAKTEIKRQPKAAERATRVITDPEQVQAWCLFMLGREPRPGEVLELVHLRDQVWELREVKP
jgi:hypothetical protein